MRKSIGNFVKTFPIMSVLVALLTGGIIAAVMRECFTNTGVSIVAGAITAMLMLVCRFFRAKDDKEQRG